MRIVLLAFFVVFWPGNTHAAKGQNTQFVSSFTFSLSDRKFGGFSGFELSDHGQNFTSVSDRGAILTGSIQRENGVIIRVVPRSLTQLRDTKGKPLRAWRDIDAEGLAIGKGGRIYVSFEHFHRVWTYDDPYSPAFWVRPYRRFLGLPPNASLEALAIGPEDALYVIPEESGKITRPFPVFRYAKGKWTVPFGLPRRGEFVPVGADFGPDGKLYVLERLSIGFLAFASRVRRFAVSENQLSNEETVLQTAIGVHDNLEGLSVWRDDVGAIRLTMISDDNFNFGQRTEIVEYSLRD